MMESFTHFTYFLASGHLCMQRNLKICYFEINSPKKDKHAEVI